MRKSSIRAASIAMLSMACGWSLPAALAQADNNVQWSGISHATLTDRSPRVPRNGEAFTVRFQSFRDDLTSARVRIDTGSVTFVDAVRVSSRGPYDIWQATIPATAATTESYILEVTDGSDTDYYSAAGMSDALNTSNPFTINFTTLEHAPTGATPVAGGVVFKVWSPSRTSCLARGTFNNWGTNAPLTKRGEYFIGFVAGAKAGDQYKYYFNNSVWNTDPYAAALVPTSSYNAVVVNQDAYAWTVTDFSPRPLQELVVYQLHVGTFAGRNDPKGSTPNPSRYIDVAARADHLAELGVNAVMLNPINEFPGDFSGGYNPISAFAIESKLGTPDQFKQMVDALHARGIAVILDVVWNHISTSDNFLWNYDGTQLWFDTPAVDTPWGAQVNYDSATIRQYYLDAAEALLSDYKLDGFRMDAVMYLTDSGNTPQWSAGQTLVRGINNLRTGRFADKHTIAELYIDSNWVTNPTSSGLGFSSQYQNEFKEAVRSAVFAAGTGNPNMQRVANVLDGQGAGVQGSQVFNYFQLHDDAWPSNGNQRAVATIDTTDPHDDQFARGRTKVGESLVLLSRGVPAILQGDEWLEDDGWETYKIDWSKKTTYNGIFQYYKDLITLRTTQPELYADSPLYAFHVNDGMDVIAFERYLTDGGSFVAVVNLSNSDRNGYRIGLPRDGAWSVIINSNDTKYAGPGGGTTGAVTVEAVSSGPFPRSTVLDIPARSVLLLQNNPPVPCAADFDGSGFLDFDDFIAFVSAYEAGDNTADFDGTGFVDFDDFNAYVAAFETGC